MNLGVNGYSLPDIEGGDVGWIGPPEDCPVSIITLYEDSAAVNENG